MRRFVQHRWEGQVKTKKGPTRVRSEVPGFCTCSGFFSLSCHHFRSERAVAGWRLASCTVFMPPFLPLLLWPRPCRPRVYFSDGQAVEMATGWGWWMVDGPEEESDVRNHRTMRFTGGR